MTQLDQDRAEIEAVVRLAAAEASRWLAGLDEYPAAIIPLPDDTRRPITLPETGPGAAVALDLFRERYSEELAGSPGPRYWGYVTGGTTPAALLGDWLATAYDQNNAQRLDSAAGWIEQETVAMLADLLGLPETMRGYFVSGATMSNTTALAAARQWAGAQHGVDIAVDGLHAAPPIPVFAGTPHSSALKALATLGMGRGSLTTIGTLPGREAIDIDALRAALVAADGAPAIVIASGGTVNTVDYDDITALVTLREEFPFWLHVDAAFGGFAACAPSEAHLLHGWERADSITVDAHKWLNVPYDSAMIFTPHTDILYAVFRNDAAYLGTPTANPDPVHMTPQNSRRFRALPAWFTLAAYGRDGYREIVEGQVMLARALGERIQADDAFRLLAPVRLNVACFALRGEPDTARRDAFLRSLHAEGTVFLTPTTLDGVPGVRAALVNWRTTEADIEAAYHAMRRAR